jgi:SAM-dependent methyltransferase
MQRLNDEGRLASQVSETDLARLLSLRGDEDLLDLGSGTGFYTDRIAPLTTGTVYALELLPEMNEHYRERGLRRNVQLLQGDMTALEVSTAGAESDPGSLAPESVDVAITIATWHEIGGRLDVPGLAKALRPGGRLIVVDWRKDPASWDNGPPEDVRYSTDEISDTLASHFTVTKVESVGQSMVALTARRT